MNTRRLIAFAIALPFIAGCQDDKEAVRLRQEIATLKTESAAVAKRLAAMEKDMDASRKLHGSEVETIATVFARVQRIESVLGERLYGPQTILEKGYAAEKAMLEAERKQTSLSAPIEAPARPQTAPVRTQPSAGVPSQAEITAANNFFSADDMVIRKCNAEWPGDANMANYCAEKQRKAVAQLKDWSSRPFGMSPDKFNPIRVACFKEWPNDFAMRVYCEGKKLGQ